MIKKQELALNKLGIEKERIFKELTTLFEDLIQTVSEQKVQENADIDKWLTKSEANIEKIKHLERNKDSTFPITTLLAIKDIQRSPGHRVNYFYEYVRSSGNLQSVCGQLKQRKVLLVQESGQDISFAGHQNSSHAGDQNYSHAGDQSSSHAGDQSSSHAGDQNSSFAGDQSSSLFFFLF